MTGSLDDLSLGVWPPAIDISTPANPQSFNPQFSVANTSAIGIVSLTRALLLVPVTTKGTNLALNTDMAPNNITSGWSFKRAPVPPSDQGYAAFVLTPDDGVGAIAPGGSVAFTLTGVSVNTVAGTAVLRLEGKTSAGVWAPTGPIQLTTPSTTPTITRHGITPGNPQTLITLQGQTVVLSWTTTGAAYCVIEDDQGKKWDSLPTSGTLSDTPLQGNSEIQSTSQLGLYYNRTYHFYAFAAGATQSDDKLDSVIIQLPTIFSFAISPANITPGQSVTVSWSAANIDPERGTITLTFDPADGTGTYTIAIAPDHLSGSGVVTPTPQTTTTYTLSVDNGYGATFSSLQQPVTSSLQPGWQQMWGLQKTEGDRVGLVTFANRLGCWSTYPLVNEATIFRSTADGAGWTDSWPPERVDGMVLADLGDGEKLWAFGTAPFVASSSDGGVNWTTQPTPPYPGRRFGNYVAGDGTILVIGGEGLTDVWSTSDGRSWTLVGNGFPLPGSVSAVARFAGKLQAVGNSQTSLLGYSSSDEGKTWSPTTVPDLWTVYRYFLLPVGGVLLLLGAVNPNGPVAVVMDPTGAWSAADLPAHQRTLSWSAATFLGCLWVGCWPLPHRDPNQGSLQFFRLNRVMPETPFRLTPAGNSTS